MENKIIDLRDYIQDDNKRTEFESALIQLLTKAAGEPVPIMLEGKIVAHMKVYAPKSQTDGE